MYICEDDYQADNIEFLDTEDIRVFQFRLGGNKEPFVEMDQKIVANALNLILDTRNHPILVHCNKGKHRVGVIMGCLRKLQRWSLASIFDEYRRISGTKDRHADLEYIEIFSAPVNAKTEYLPEWITFES